MNGQSDHSVVLLVSFHFNNINRYYCLFSNVVIDITLHHMVSHYLVFPWIYIHYILHWHSQDIGIVVYVVVQLVLYQTHYVYKQCIAMKVIKVYRADPESVVQQTKLLLFWCWVCVDILLYSHHAFTILCFRRWLNRQSILTKNLKCYTKSIFTLWDVSSQQSWK